MIINFKTARASARLKARPSISLPDNMQGKACLSAGMIDQLYYSQGIQGIAFHSNVMNAMESIALAYINRAQQSLTNNQGA